MVITPNAQITFRRFSFGSQVIAWIELNPVVARILSDVFQRHNLQNYPRFILDHSKQQSAALFREGAFAVAFNLFDLVCCQFNAHSSFQNFSLRYLLASSHRIVTITPSSIRSATLIAATIFAPEEIPTNQPSRRARSLTMACESSVLISICSSSRDVS